MGSNRTSGLLEACGWPAGLPERAVYSHAIELGGAVKVDSGPKLRLRFDPEIAARALQRIGEIPAADPGAHDLEPPRQLGHGLPRSERGI